MKASDIMTLGAATVSADASLFKALRIMLDHRISALPVLDENDHLLGIVTEGDFVRSGVIAFGELFAKGELDRTNALQSRTVSEIMSRNPITISPESSIQDVVKLMEQHTLKRILVVSNGQALGVISRVDLLRKLIE